MSDLCSECFFSEANCVCNRPYLSQSVEAIEKQRVEPGTSPPLQWTCPSCLESVKDDPDLGEPSHSFEVAGSIRAHTWMPAWERIDTDGSKPTRSGLDWDSYDYGDIEPDDDADLEPEAIRCSECEAEYYFGSDAYTSAMAIYDKLR